MRTYLFHEFKISLHANKSLGATIKAGRSLINEKYNHLKAFWFKDNENLYLSLNLCEIAGTGRKVIKEMETYLSYSWCFYSVLIFSGTCTNGNVRVHQCAFGWFEVFHFFEFPLPHHSNICTYLYHICCLYLANP